MQQAHSHTNVFKSLVALCFGTYVSRKHSAAEEWKRENESAIKAYNDHIENDGVFSDGVRKF